MKGEAIISVAAVCRSPSWAESPACPSAPSAFPPSSAVALTVPSLAPCYDSVYAASSVAVMSPGKKRKTVATVALEYPPTLAYGCKSTASAAGV